MTLASDGLPFTEPSGSNGIAIAPSNTGDGHALLLINPHTSFFFRSELQMTQRRGARTPMARRPGGSSSSTRASTPTPAGCTPPAASTMSMSSPRPSSRKDGRLVSTATARSCGRCTVKTDRRCPTARADGSLATRSFTIYATHHGPIVRAGRRQVDRIRADEQADRGARAIVPAHQGQPTTPSFMKVAAAAGQLLQQHPVRRRQGRDRLSASAVRARARRPLRLHASPWTAAIRPPTGRACTRSTSLPHVVNPANGWVLNTNNWPYSAAGPDSPKARRLSRATWTAQARTPAACTRCCVLTDAARLHASDADARRHSIRYLPAFARCVPPLVRGLRPAAGRAIR